MNEAFLRETKQSYSGLQTVIIVNKQIGTSTVPPLADRLQYHTGLLSAQIRNFFIHHLICKV